MGAEPKFFVDDKNVTFRPLSLNDLTALAFDNDEPNPFYAPWHLQAALTHLPTPDGLQLLTGFCEDNRPIGFIPIMRGHTYARLPIKHWRNFTNDFCFLGSPLIKAGYEQKFFTSLFDWLEKNSSLPMLRLTGFPSTGPIANGLAKSIAHRHAYIARTDERAIMQSSLTGEAYLENNIRKKKRKEFNRLNNRIHELGLVQFEETTSLENSSDWVDDFLTLENQGWKGQEGTSLLSVNSNANYFRTACHAAVTRHALHIARLTLDGRTIAAIISFLDGNAQFTSKIAHDESLSRFSPGVMLELELTKRTLDMYSGRWIDSCAKPDHSMINHLWAERRILVQWTIALNGWQGELTTRLCRTLEQLSATLKTKKHPNETSSVAP